MPHTTGGHNMVRYRFLRSAAIALGVYGVLGLVIAAAMLVVGLSTFREVTRLQHALDSERASLVLSIRTVSGTLQDTSRATTNFKRSIDDARDGADRASTLANDAAGTFRDLGTRVTAINIFGLAPLAGLGPQFSTSADQLQQLAISLGSTRDALLQNGNDIQRVGTDLAQLKTQLDAVATSLSQPDVLRFEAHSLLPFQVAFYGMCLLVALQSLFSIIGCVVLFRLQRALGGEALFPHIAPEVRTATTSVDGAAERGRVQVS